MRSLRQPRTTRTSLHLVRRQRPHLRRDPGYYFVYVEQKGDFITKENYFAATFEDTESYFFRPTSARERTSERTSADQV